MSDNKEAIIEPEVEYEKSIKKQSLVYKKTTGYVFTMVVSYIIFLFFMFITVMLLFVGPIDSPHTPIWCIVFGIFIVGWMLSNIYFNNKLVKIKGTNIQQNKEDILATMDEFFSSYDFVINNEKMMRSFKPPYQPIWGRIITILFDGNVMYLNITSLGKSDSPTLIHGFLNFLKAKRISKYFKSHYSK